MKKFLLLIGLLAAWLPSQAQRWRSHFAYNNVTQIAVAEDRVYAISDGSLFSVEKQSEQIQTYDRQSGLHSSGIACISYDPNTKILFIAYKSGKIDILSANGVRYVGDLYDKDMTQKKTVYNLTFAGRTAYLSTHYGVQTFDLLDNKLVDSYWLRPGGLETPIGDVLIQNDSIYAFGLDKDSLYCAALKDNLVDYTVWKREPWSSRISPDDEKGKHYVDGTDHWYAGGLEGIVRFTTTERLTYKPKGPLVNTPYRIHASQGRVFVVPGGRWDVQYNKPGVVMIYEDEQWTNISSSAIEAVTHRRALDFVNVATDPRNNRHYYVTSYGTGLYEFLGDSLVSADIAGGDNTLVSAIPDAPATYTRLDCAICDSAGNVWLIDAGIENQLQCKEINGTWHGLTIMANGRNLEFYTPGGLVIDRFHPQYKWMCTARYNTFLCLMDDKGTPYDTSDDHVMVRSEWQNQKGQPFHPDYMYVIQQDPQGRLWLCTEQGPAYIEKNTDFFTSNQIIQPELIDDNGENPLAALSIQGICFDGEEKVWLGTETMGVYVLNSDATEIVAHYTMDNSAMPSNSVLSLECTEQGVVFIGTGEGLVEFDPSSPSDSSTGFNNKEENGYNQGVMQQWKLHYSYESPQELASTPARIYALANGAIFYLDRSTDQLEYISKATGLNGSTVRHIAYDSYSKQLIIAYEDGRIDLLSDDDEIRTMPDLYMKAHSIPTTINAITTGNKHCYLAMPFGIVAIDARKAVVTDTYYIGENASSVDVRQIIVRDDSIFAFSQDAMYSASLADNLVDYAHWHKQALPSSSLTQAVYCHNDFYAILQSNLYRRHNGEWSQVLAEPVRWIRASNGKLIFSYDGVGVYQLNENAQVEPLAAQYYINDAVFSQNEYWLAESGYGLIRLSVNGEDYFHPAGPNSNFGYAMTTTHGQLYSVIGGRWASEYGRAVKINIFDGTEWRKIASGSIASKIGYHPIDAVSIAVDPKDASHFYVASYGSGVLEFRNYEFVTQYTRENSTLQPTSEAVEAKYYTRTDGAMVDDEQNLWVLNSTSIGYPLHLRTKTGQWHAIPLMSRGQLIKFTTPTGLWVDNRNSQWKWMLDQRSTPGVILFDDGGTSTNTGDDRCIKRSDFVDQNNNTLTPASFRCFAQDKTNRIWIGTEKGIILIPSNVDFFTSNACRRIIIPRNDGTGLGDYLLGDEQINCLTVDGGNRMWIGTASSGLYLIEDDTITVAHFTENNSLLPSNSILSIVIMPETGEVFVGTDKGIASYHSDASEPNPAMNSAYAYPNPVRPSYSGVISICGLMDNTVVNIIDSGGNLVCKTRSHGGTAVWDGKLSDGRRATPGVYTALCNASSGHTVVKILVMR